MSWMKFTEEQLKNEIREKLHQLLDQMLDDKLPLGVLQKATNVDGRLKFDKYELILRKEEGFYGDMD